MDIKKKVESIEKKLNLNNRNKIPEWALKAAEWKSAVEKIYYNPELIAAYKKAGIDKEDRPPKLQTRVEIIAFAKEISEKYTCRDDYISSTCDYAAIRKLLEEMEKQTNYEQ